MLHLHTIFERKVRIKHFEMSQEGNKVFELTAKKSIAQIEHGF